MVGQRVKRAREAFARADDRYGRNARCYSTQEPAMLAIASATVPNALASSAARLSLAALLAMRSVGAVIVVQRVHLF